MDSLQAFFFGTLHNSHVSFTTERFVDVRDVARLHILGLTSPALSSPGVRFWTFNNIIANDIRRRSSIGYEGCSMKGLVCSRSRQTNNSVRVGNKIMNLDQTPSPKKGEALPKRGDADSADHIVRAYSPITTASHSWLFIGSSIHSSHPITPSSKTCFRK